MAYCTQQDLIDRFGAKELTELTDRTNRPATTIDDEVVARHVGDASALVDSYLRKRYALPLTSIPSVLVKVSADIARYFLNGKAAIKGSPVETAYRDALDWLADVAEGTVVLEDDDGDDVAPAGNGQVQSSGPNRVFTRDSLRRL